MEWGKLVADEGVEAAQDRAEAGAEDEAERDRRALLDEQGDDVNHATEHITEIRRLDRS